VSAADPNPIKHGFVPSGGNI